MTDITKTPVRSPDPRQPDEVRKSFDNLSKRATQLKADLDTKIAARTYTYGDGVDLADKVVTADIDTNAGLQFGAGKIQVNLGNGVEFSSGAVQAKLSSQLAFSSGSITLSASGFTSTAPDSSSRFLADNGGGGWERHSLTQIRDAMFTGTGTVTTVTTSNTLTAPTVGTLGTGGTTSKQRQDEAFAAMTVEVQKVQDKLDLLSQEFNDLVNYLSTQNVI